MSTYHKFITEATGITELDAARKALKMAKRGKK